MLGFECGCDVVAQDHPALNPAAGNGMTQQRQVQISLLVYAKGLGKFRRIIDGEMNKVGGANWLKGQIGAPDCTGTAGNEGAGRGDDKRCAAVATEISVEATPIARLSFLMAHTRYQSP